MGPDEHNQRLLKKRRLLAARVTLFGCLVVVVLLGLKIFFPTSPHFGGIYEATAFDLNEARSDRLAAFLRDHLPRRIVQSPHFPSRFKAQPRYLHLGNTQLEWSIGGTNTGWLYFWGIGPNRALTKGKWEFAPCAETNLMNVVRVPVVFYGFSDPRRAEVFGESSTPNAIKVSVGQILFARRTDETNRIYILKLKEQRRNKLVVHYCVTTQK